MSDFRPHRELEVWKKAMDFVIEVYRIISDFPKSEEYGLTSQLRRASISIPSNLAEGAARKGNKEFMQFLNVAQGSISELDTQLELAYRLEYINKQDYSSLINRLTEISKMLYGLAKTLR
ncbi:MAG: four helix bundle protein [Thermodesulfobacteriota bacterium]